MAHSTFHAASRGSLTTETLLAYGLWWEGCRQGGEGCMVRGLGNGRGRESLGMGRRGLLTFICFALGAGPPPPPPPRSIDTRPHVVGCSIVGPGKLQPLPGADGRPDPKPVPVPLGWPLGTGVDQMLPGRVSTGQSAPCDPCHTTPKSRASFVKRKLAPT